MAGTLFYRLGRWLLDRTTRIYFRSIEAEGLENIPRAGPAILVANHPNSIADAFLLASQIDWCPLSFIAKDTIARLPLVGWLVRRFGVVGVARQMEYAGRAKLARQINEAAIGSCTPRLAAGGLVLIFGEGISTDSRRLLAIRKGAMRIGYAAEEAHDFRLGVAFVPAGINYSSKQKFRSEVLMRVGQAFCLVELAADPRAEKARVLAEGTARLQTALESLTTNIVADELAPLVDRLAELRAAARRRSPALWFDVQRQIADALAYWNQAAPHRVLGLRAALTAYEQALERTGLTDDVVRQRHPREVLWASVWGLLKSVVFLGVNLYGWINNLGPRYVGRAFRLASRLVRKVAERIRGQPWETGVSRETFVTQLGGWLGAAIGYPLQVLLVAAFAWNRWGLNLGTAIAALYAASLIPSWRFSLAHSERMSHYAQQALAAWQFLRRPRPALRLARQRRRLMAETDALVRDYEALAPVRETTPRA